MPRFQGNHDSFRRATDVGQFPACRYEACGAAAQGKSPVRPRFVAYSWWRRVLFQRLAFREPGVFFLIRLILLPMWLRFKILGEVIEHSGRRGHY